MYQNEELPWLRWWDAQGNLLLTGDERAETERYKREIIVEKLRRRSPSLAKPLVEKTSLSVEKLKDLGIDPEMLD